MLRKYLVPNMSSYSYFVNRATEGWANLPSEHQGRLLADPGTSGFFTRLTYPNHYVLQMH